MRRLFRQFSFPGGIPSHVAPETPGSIHEGGEPGYSLTHAYGAAFDNPDLVVLCVDGDGEAETGPLAASWHSNKFLDPAQDGAVLLEGYGHQPIFVAGDDPLRQHMVDERLRHRAYTREFGEDPDDVRGWTWPG
jgi:xylulose-5-phosphate/fructose-6-phosphate phosphoketolase